MDKNKLFESYIQEYVALPLKEKEKKFLDELLELIAITQKFCIDYHVDDTIYVNRELSDIKKEDYTRDDFVEASYVYLQILKELYGNFFNKYVNDNYVTVNNENRNE